MKPFLLAMAGLVAGADVGAQTRTLQVSTGGGTATAQIATGETDPSERGGNIQPLTGRQFLGTGIGERLVVGLDMFWSYLPQRSGYSAVRNAESNIHSLTALAKLYPARRGFFVELGAGWATTDVDMARAGGATSSGRWLARGGALRYGVGYDFDIGAGLALTPYIAGMFMPKPVEHTYSCECIVANYPMPNSAPDAGLPWGGPFSPKFDSPLVNVVHAGVAITYTLRPYWRRPRRSRVKPTTVSPTEDIASVNERSRP